MSGAHSGSALLNFKATLYRVAFYFPNQDFLNVAMPLEKNVPN
jgi:hypothetical protein